MPLTRGVRLGPYEVVSPLGAGGMGEVYRARDAKLGRDVAIKVLPEAIAKEPEALVRFEREARAVAALSHPNILSIFDFGSHQGIAYAVMELLEGETIRQKLDAGPVPLQRAVAWASAIARGLAAAHEKGIVHRDLKPENLFVTKDGHVKILDFGLARQLALAADASDTKSPTLAHSTEPGVILGTIAYMSPEQVRGLPADPRSDIFAFGCVLYELLSRGRPFRGASALETMHAIVHNEPAELPPAVREAAPALSRVVRTCLAKEPRERWQSAADLARELDWLGDEEKRPGSAPPAASSGSARRYGPFLALVLGIAMVAVVAAVVVASKRKTLVESPVIRFTVAPPERTTIQRNVLSATFAPSPDGGTIAFVAATDGRAALWLWSVTDAAATRLKDTDGAISPFWSPDGLSIAFFSEGKLKRIPSAGGPAQALCDAPFGHAGSWGTKGVILYSEWTGPGQGIHRVPAEGGAATNLSLADGDPATSLRASPSFLPDGRRFLYTRGVIGGLIEDRRLCVGDLGSQDARCLIQSDSRVQYAPPGRLLFVRKGTLLSQPFDEKKGAVSGRAEAIAERVSVFAPTANADFAVSADGRLLVFRHGAPASRLAWLDRSGREAGSIGRPGYFGFVRISPDGRRLATDVEDPATGGRDVWLFDVASGIGSRLTFDPVDAGWPVWSPDGAQLLFGSGSKGPPDLYLKDLGGTLAEKLVFSAPGTQFPSDWTRDGRFVAYVDYLPSRKAQRQIFILPLGGERKPMPLGGNPFSEYEPRFSPDSRFVAFVSEESGPAEVYVAAVDGTGQKQRVSPAGGSLPIWSRDRKELFFVAADGVLMTVAVTGERDLRFAAPKPLFSLPPFPFQADYDVSPDGQRFLVNLGTESSRQPPLTAVLGWQQRFASGARAP